MSDPLIRIKLLHTGVWFVFASAIIAIPFATMLGRFDVAFWLSLLTWGEVFVLALNGMHCPLTAIAARHTDNRAANFDIYLPEFLARHNKAIFGPLFAAGQVFLLMRWVG